MTRLISILVLVMAFSVAGLCQVDAQDSKISDQWTRISLCQIHFLIPKNLKNQYAKGIDSCVAQFKSGKMSLLIDYGVYSGAFGNDDSKLDFKEEIVEINGKKAQIVTYKSAPPAKGKFMAGLYALIFEAQDGRNISLNMTMSVKNEKDLETAKAIFRSLQFDEYKPFSVEW